MCDVIVMSYASRGWEVDTTIVRAGRVFNKVIMYPYSIRYVPLWLLRTAQGWVSRNLLREKKKRDRGRRLQGRSSKKTSHLTTWWFQSNATDAARVLHYAVSNASLQHPRGWVIYASQDIRDQREGKKTCSGLRYNSDNNDAWRGIG